MPLVYGRGDSIEKFARVSCIMIYILFSEARGMKMVYICDKAYVGFSLDVCVVSCEGTGDNALLFFGHDCHTSTVY